ncbi:MAG: TIGR03564 family F420-dependent LLM class oxidoreductase, partial [Ilumatobacteraceae bacterium]
MRIGLVSNTVGEGTIDDVINEAREAAADGFHTLWTPQIFGFDALTLLALVGRAVPGIELGTAVVPTYPRHPMMLAQQALTVQAATGGRLALGIGLSHQIVVENMWGISFEKPVRHMREYLNVLMPMLEGKPVAFNGETYRVNAAAQVAGGSRPSVLVAALGAQMLRLCGALTDGTSLWCVGPETIRNFTVPTLSEAAEAAGRPAPRVEALHPLAAEHREASTRPDHHRLRSPRQGPLVPARGLRHRLLRPVCAPRLRRRDATVPQPPASLHGLHDHGVAL